MAIKVIYEGSRGDVDATVLGSKTNQKTGTKRLIVAFDGFPGTRSFAPASFAERCVNPSDYANDSAQDFNDLLESIGLMGSQVTEVESEEETEVESEEEG